MSCLKKLYVFSKLVSVNNTLHGKLVSLLEFPVNFIDRLKVTSVQFFVADFSLLSCELDNFTFNMLY